MNKQVTWRGLTLSVAASLGVILILATLRLVAAQGSSEISMSRDPIVLEQGETISLDWTITFTNTPISYSLTIYDPFDVPQLSNEYPAIGATSPITGHQNWTPPPVVPSGPYLAEILFFTEEISNPFDSQAAVTFLVLEQPTPTPSICEGDIQVYKCEDKNANGVCREPHIDRPLPGVQVCIDPVPGGQDSCKTTNQDGYARWLTLPCGSYVVSEQLIGPFKGYYPSSPMEQRAVVENGQTAEITFSNVFPLRPMGVAVNPDTNKVYVAFQNIKELDRSRPYAFVAVIDSETDRVIATVPDVGDEPVGVAVADGKVYVAAYREGAVSVIDGQTDQLITRITGFVNPTWLATDPGNHLLYVTDYGNGQVRAIDTTSDTIVEGFGVSDSQASGPFDVAASGGFAYTSLRSAPWTDRDFPFNPYLLKAVQRPGGITSIPFVYNNHTGSPHAIAARTAGADTYLYVTYAPEPRDDWPSHQWDPTSPDQPMVNPVNPDRLSVVQVPGGNPAAAQRLETDVRVGDFAEAGLVYNPNTNHLLGTYGGAYYDQAYPDWLACAIIPNFHYPKTRDESGGIYVLDAGNPQSPGLIGNPVASLRVGNSTAPMSGDFWWRNPFDLAVNPNNDKVYVTDRCWHDFDFQYDNLFPEHEIWHNGGGAVFVFNDGGAMTSLASPPKSLAAADELPTSGDPTVSIIGPDSAIVGATFQVSIVASGIISPGIFGAQFDLTFDPAYFEASDLQTSPQLPLAVIETVDNATGRVRFAASRQGDVENLSGDIVLAAVNLTPLQAVGSTTLGLEGVMLGAKGGVPVSAGVQGLSLSIADVTPPEPTPTPTPTATPEPTATPTPGDVTVSGQVTSQGRRTGDWGGATVSIEGTDHAATTDPDGLFELESVAAGVYSIRADAPGHLPATCPDAILSAPTTALNLVQLLSGDITGDGLVDIEDATAIGVVFGQIGPDLPADLNADEQVNVMDLILLAVNFGEGPQTWDCTTD